MEKKCYFNTDVDGVIIPGQELMDEYVYNDIDKIASDRYRYELVARINELRKKKEELEDEQRFFCPEMKEIEREIKEYERKKAIHYEHKNMVLEEVTPELEGRIPYDEIYQLKNLYPGMADALYKLYEAGIFDGFTAPSNVNKDREIRAKLELFKHFPFVQLLPLQFFIEPFYLPGGKVKALNRIPSNKAATLAKIKKDMDIPISPLIDDTPGVIDSARPLGFPCYFRSRDDDPVDIYYKAANDTIDIVHGGKIKKLSR